jgi:Arc/MetJ-type ribon-helix-helix transcriptional regulator
VDLGKIDYLVEQGFYSTRSDFMRAAIRTQLQAHDPVVSDEALYASMSAHTVHSDDIRKIWVVGIISLDRASFEKHKLNGTKAAMFVVGALVIEQDVDLQTVKDIVVSAKIYGSISGPTEVVQYLRAIARK